MLLAMHRDGMCLLSMFDSLICSVHAHLQGDSLPLPGMRLGQSEEGDPGVGKPFPSTQSLLSPAGSWDSKQAWVTRILILTLGRLSSWWQCGLN